MRDNSVRKKNFKKLKNKMKTEEIQFIDDIVLALGQNKDFIISYRDKNNRERYICLAAMNEIDVKDRFNDMFPDNTFISAKEI